MKGPRKKPAPPGWRWVYCKTVRHWRSGKNMKRRDGLPFKFLVRA